MQSTTVTRSIAQVAFTIAQATPLSAPSFALSPLEEMAMLGISEADFADRAHGVALVESEAEPTLPDYCETPNANRTAYLGALRSLWQTITDAGMSEAGRHEGASKYLGVRITSFRQLTPAQMNRLEFGIGQGHLTQDWELAVATKPAVAQPLEALPTLPVLALTHAERVAQFAAIGVELG